MTPNELSTLIAEKQGRPLDVPFKLMIMERAKAWRSRLLKNTLEFNPIERRFFKQTIIVKMEKQFITGCVDVPGVNCMEAVSDEIPQPLRVGGTLFDYVGGVDGKSPFGIADIGTEFYLNAGKYSQGEVRYTWHSPRIKVNRPTVPYIMVTSIFDDPVAVNALTCEGQGDCDYWDKEWPAGGELLQLIIQSLETIDFRRPNEPDNDRRPEVLVGKERGDQ